MAEAKREHALKVHHLRPAPGAKTAKTRVGRGEASGACLRGDVGQVRQVPVDVRFVARGVHEPDGASRPLIARHHPATLRIEGQMR